MNYAELKKLLTLLGVAISGIGVVSLLSNTTAPESSIAAVAGNQFKKERCMSVMQRQFESEPYYTGQLIDSHVHLPAASGIIGAVAKQFGEEVPVWGKPITADYVSCLFKGEGIAKAFGFYLVPKFAESASVAAAKKGVKEHQGEIVPFFMPPPMPFLQVAPESVEQTLKKNPGLFKGYGEIALDRDTSRNVEPDDPELEKIYALAETYDLIVMMHPRFDQAAAVEKIVSEHPKVRFLLHGLTRGPNDNTWVFGLIEKYKNTYYSVDTIFGIYGWTQDHRWKKPTKEEWLAHMRDNFDSLLAASVREWKPRIERFPERLMWSTDRSYAWHFEPEVSSLIVEYSRAFIGSLDISVQMRFAYKNAEALLAGKPQ